MRKCCVIGLGYIGLPTSVLLAKAGHIVIGCDINKSLVETINEGKETISENNLNQYLGQVLSEGRFKAQTNLDNADIFLIAVPTPFLKNDDEIPQPNLEFVFDAAKEIAKYVKEGNLIIIESTIPVGTTEKVAKLIAHNSSLSLDKLAVAHCPERVLPGNILEELVSNDRVIGVLKEVDSERFKKFYSTFCKGELFLTNTKTAELIKLTENAYRDTNIAFANEISMISDRYGIDVLNLISIANHHPRVNILKPGCGVGGHCIAVDPWFIVADCPEYTPLIKSARMVNMNKSKWVIEKILLKSKDFYKNNGRKPIIGCLGLTFKADVEDLRESPALNIVLTLIKESENVIASEPNISSHENIKLVKYEEILKKADILVGLVAHKEFNLKTIQKTKIMDFCGLNKY